MGDISLFLKGEGTRRVMSDLGYKQTNREMETSSDATPLGEYVFKRLGRRGEIRVSDDKDLEGRAQRNVGDRLSRWAGR
jgi:hypothetical protein